MAKIKGLSKLLKELDKFGEDAKKVIDAEMESTSQDMAKVARSEVRVDTGKLKQSIRAYKKALLNHFLEVGGDLAPYAPYVEFGTGGLVEVPKGFEEDANKARGKGIRLINRTPRPFMHPAFLFGQKELPKRIEKELKILAKKV